MRKIITNCPNCNSTKIDPCEFLYKYGTRYLICHYEMDNATEEEIQKDQEAFNLRQKDREKLETLKRYKLFLELKKEFESGQLPQD